MNYKKVIEDFNNGTIDRKKWKVVMDNDDGYWECLDDSLDEDDQDTQCAEMEEKYGRPDGYRDVVEILAAAGVNVDWC